jgi:CheY-like chemotaxis protein
VVVGHLVLRQRPDLILADIEMPFMDEGDELAVRVIAWPAIHASFAVKEKGLWR